MTEAITKTRHGAIVFDSGIFESVSEDLFSATGWQTKTPVSGSLRAAGRGNTLIVANDLGEFVLRQYIRGGLIGRLIKDAYIWIGEDETRCFAEWRLLDKLVQAGFNVPTPAAAIYRRNAMFYTADLLTVRIPGICSLADRLLEAPVPEAFWQLLGAAICRFHNAQIYHADMNAYNVQLDEHDELWLLDFDRGRLSPKGTWKQQTLSRLHRSLRKIKRLSPKLQYSELDWNHFLEGYFNESRSA